MSSKAAVDQLSQLGTGHGFEEIKQILKECKGDIIEASNRLLEGTSRGGSPETCTPQTLVPPFLTPFPILRSPSASITLH